MVRADYLKYPGTHVIKIISHQHKIHYYMILAHWLQSKLCFVMPRSGYDSTDTCPAAIEWLHDLIKKISNGTGDGETVGAVLYELRSRFATLPKPQVRRSRLALILKADCALSATKIPEIGR